MRIRIAASTTALILALTFAPFLHSQYKIDPNADTTPASMDQPFDPHDLSGTWRGYSKGKGPGGIQNWASFDQKIPEPPISEWARQHLMYKSISHDSLGGPHLPGWDKPGHICPDAQDPCFATDPNGVPANDLNGEYPAKDCEPLSTPAIYDYPGLAIMQFVPTPDGSRIHQFFEYHREWRTFWLDRAEHPKDLDPTYEGNSIAHWEGNTLVVDTIGYNTKTMVTQNVGHSKSEAFHLAERIRRLDHDHLVIDMTYSDPKVWGDKSWPGFQKYYYLDPQADFQEFICSPREYQVYEKGVIAPETGAAK